MPRTLRIVLYAVGGLVCLSVLATAVLFFVDINVFKPRLETLASSTLGMQVNIGGRLGIGILPRLHITVQDVQVRNRGKDFIFAKEADLGLRFAPLLHREVRFSQIALKDPRITIERDRDGHYNYEEPDEAKQARRQFHLVKIHISGGTLRYVDKLYDENIQAEDCDGDLSDVRHPGGSELLSQLSLTAEFACGELRTKKVTASDLKLSLDGKDGIFDFKPLTMAVFGGQGSGGIRLERSGPVPRTNVHYTLSRFRIGDYFRVFSPNAVANGLMDFSVNLSMQGRTRNDQRRTANGEVTLLGKDLTLVGKDLDKDLAQYASSQNFNLIDVSAFFFAGPVGLAVTKGYDFSSLFQRSGGNTPIRVLVSRWKVENGVALAQDVALATKENRLALHGGLDFVHEEYKGVTVALIDAKGCAKVTQDISGPFLKPVVEKPHVLVAIAGPALNLLRKARDFITNRKCQVFYSGSVPQPT